MFEKVRHIIKVHLTILLMVKLRYTEVKELSV